ncbi:MAG TPA: DMT family transporter [Pseudonocardiaceae bacterium]
MNGELGQRLDDAVVAAACSNLGALLLLVALAALGPRVQCGLRRVLTAIRDRALPRHQLLGGTCGAVLLVCQELTVATIGVAVFTVAVVAGQTASSLPVDRVAGGQQPVTARRAAGAGLALGAVMLAVGAAAAIVPVTGVLLLGLAAVAGQLVVGPLPLDVFLPAGPSQVTSTTLIGTALTLVSVTVVALPGRRPRTRVQRCVS